jgi:tight adherence protein B
VKQATLITLIVGLLALPASAVASTGLEVRHVDFSAFPQVRVTVLAPAGTRPTLFEDGRGAGFVRARQLGSAEALILAVDNSESMRGRPLQEAKRAAQTFLLAQGGRALASGLVAFGHEALPLTRRNEPSSAVAQTLAALAPDTQTGTALYDAVVSSASRLRGMSSGTRILVLLTDGHDLGSRASLRQAVAAAQRENVVVYAIASGTRADKQTLATLAGSTGGRLFDSANVSALTATYAALARELDRTWQLSYLTRGRPGDPVTLDVRAGTARARVYLRVPGAPPSGSGAIPRSVLHDPRTAAAIVALAALLLAMAGASLVRWRRTPQIRRLLDPHLKRIEKTEERREQAGPLGPLLEWTEGALADLPGSERLERAVERSGLKLRVGYVPYLAVIASICFGLLGAATAAGAGLSILLMLIGLTTPFVVFWVATARRSKAFDRQLPDVLATIASTLRAGHGLRTALRAVADDGSPPASEELKRVLGEERLGRPLDEAITAMCERIGSEDLEYVATAINVQSQAGGSLATLFDTLSETVRERQRHARKVRALTSMGRMSAMILTALPFGLAFLMTVISPSYMAPFYRTSTGHVLIVFCLVSMTLGALLLKRIVNVRY